MVSLWVVNASPIILLTKIGQLDLLNRLGEPRFQAATVGAIGPGSTFDSQSAWANACTLGSAEPRLWISRRAPFGITTGGPFLMIRQHATVRALWESLIKARSAW